jgi:hypothetical protein
MNEYILAIAKYISLLCKPNDGLSKSFIEGDVEGHIRRGRKSKDGVYGIKLQ